MSTPITPSPPDGEQPVPPVAQEPTTYGWARPEATEGSLDHVTREDQSAVGGQWSPVDRRRHRGSAQSVAPPIPRAVKVGGAILIVAILGLASWLGLTLGSSTPSATVTASPPPREWPLDPPSTHGDWVRGDYNTQPPVEGQDRVVVSASYADGAQRIVLLLSRPELDLEQYLADANIGQIETVGQDTCGRSQDTDAPLCVRITDDTAIMVAGLDQQDFTQLSGLVEEFHGVLVGE